VIQQPSACAFVCPKRRTLEVCPKKEAVVHQLKNTSLLAVVFIAMILLTFSFALAQDQDPATTTSSNEAAVGCGPPSYGCARSDLIPTENLNPPPDVSKGKNTLVTPSDFNLPVLRVTDATTYKNQTFTVTPGGSNSVNIFNTNDTYMLVVDGGGWSYPVSLSPSTMQVANSEAWTVGSNQFRWSGASSFSRSNPNTLFTVMNKTSLPGVTPNSTTLYSLALSGTTSISATAKRVFDFASCPGMPKPYNIGHGVWHATLSVSGGDKRFAEAFSNQRGGQDTGTDVTVYDAASGQCYRYDTAHAKLCTKTGCAPMGLPDEFTIHGVSMSLNGEYMGIGFHHCIKGGCMQGSDSNPYYWQIGTTNIVRCYNPSGSANCTGHQTHGYSHVYNAIGWPRTAKRLLSDPLSYTEVNSVPVLTPSTDTHFSNNAADVNDTNPFWVTDVQNVHTTFGGAGCRGSGNVYEGCIFPGPLYGEIFGITQRGGYIRAAHSYNSGASSNFNCASTIGSVSQSGKFFAWTSDWLTTLGSDATNAHRCDVFVVNLAALQGAKN
jgi:hypothetical protein